MEFMHFSLFRPSNQSSWFYTHRFAIMMMLYVLLLIVIGASNSPTFVYYWHRMFDSEKWIDKLFLFTTCLKNSQSAMHCICSRALEIKVPGAFQFCHLMASCYLFWFLCSCDSWGCPAQLKRITMVQLSMNWSLRVHGKSYLKLMKTKRGSAQV